MRSVFEQPHLSVEHVAVEISAIGRLINQRQMETGLSPGPFRAYAELAIRLDASLSISEPQYQTLYAQIRAAFLRSLPLLAEGGLPNFLTDLRSRPATVSLLSNTVFVGGGVMREALGELGLSSQVDFMHFSDETGYAKPSRLAFEGMIRDAMQINPRLEGPSQILHVGDDLAADGAAPLCGVALKIVDKDRPISLGVDPC